jgi:hypothetical protein
LQQHLDRDQGGQVYTKTVAGVAEAGEEEEEEDEEEKDGVGEQVLSERRGDKDGCIEGV